MLPQKINCVEVDPKINQKVHPKKQLWEGNILQRPSTLTTAKCGLPSNSKEDSKKLKHTSVCEWGSLQLKLSKLTQTLWHQFTRMSETL